MGLVRAQSTNSTRLERVKADKSLSITAKNVKIITVGTKVTLRGTVQTEEEKSAVLADVQQVANVTDVDNQIEVKK